MFSVIYRPSVNCMYPQKRFESCFGCKSRSQFANRFLKTTKNVIDQAFHNTRISTSLLLCSHSIDNNGEPHKNRSRTFHPRHFTRTAIKLNIAPGNCNLNATDFLMEVLRGSGVICKLIMSLSGHANWQNHVFKVRTSQGLFARHAFLRVIRQHFPKQVLSVQFDSFSNNINDVLARPLWEFIFVIG